MRLLLIGRAIGTLIVAGARVWSQTATLQIKPHAGDTLRMRLDQQSEMTGIKRTSLGEASAMVIGTMSMFSRAIVEGSSEKGTTLLAVTDSVVLSTTDEHARSDAMQAAARMRGQRVRFRVTPDGTVGMAEEGDGASREVAQVVSLMPAAFPKSAIKIGESWIREMLLPTGNQFGAQLSGKLHVTFRFDSLTHGGDWAFVSMRGEMQPATGPGAAFGASLEKGVVSGTMLVDQKRGWLTESWFNILVSSNITQPLMAGVVSMRMQMRITQHMHTVERAGR
ncbi:MAG TPA: hypothetical protein VK636_21420 [Gemmatimonadaceae bacterium]|nr:hypothetical protein [Gemmatimonadaceae bacterium]